MNFDYSLKVLQLPIEKLERLEDLGCVHFPRDYRAEVLNDDRPLHADEQPEITVDDVE